MFENTNAQHIEQPRAKKQFNPTEFNTFTTAVFDKNSKIRNDVLGVYALQPLPVDLRIRAPHPRIPPAANNGAEQRAEQNIDEDAFWRLIGECGWTNKGDGRRGTTAHIKALKSAQYDQFMRQYDRLYDGLKKILDNERILLMRGITDPLEVRKIVSHVIALGKESYYTIIAGEMTFIEYFIDSDQCVSFDAEI